MTSKLKIIGCLIVSGILFLGCSPSSSTAGIRLNQIQVIGTHNSYHQLANPSLMTLIERADPQAARNLDYGHRLLHEQLSQLGIRQLELDCYCDPDGGRFAQPLGPIKAVASGLPQPPSNDPDGELKKPGIKVLHMPDIDFGTSALTLVDGLREVRTWSLHNPRHIPIFILIELKDETLGLGFTQALPWCQTDLAELEREILSVFPRETILTPDDVRGAEKTLPEALRKHGWPLLDDVRGKVMFGMDNEGREREQYLLGHPVLEERILFVSVPPDSPAAAWMKRNNPIKDFTEIQNLVKGGFLVRTRADEPTEQARANDTKMRDHALASGAQFISTDYPEPNLNFSPYHVGFDNGHVAQVNTVNGPLNLSGKEIE